MTLRKLAVILTVLVWVSDSLADHRHSRRSSNEYILHRCTATAELIRKHRNEEAIGVNSRKAGVDLSSQIKSQVQPQIQRKSFDSAAMISPFNASRLEVPKQISDGVHRRATHTRRRGNAQARRIAGKYLIDTPLRTLHIDVPQNRPTVFGKKSLLPELSRDVSGRKIDSSQNVVIIKPVA